VAQFREAVRRGDAGYAAFSGQQCAPHAAQPGLLDQLQWRNPQMPGAIMVQRAWTDRQYGAQQTDGEPPIGVVSVKLV